ncbi:MAG TPA: FAD-binding protein, partial [Ancylobacter sp.]
LDAWHRPLGAVLDKLPAVAARIATGSRAQGTALVRGLVGGFVRAGGRILTDTRAVELITGGDRNVTGIRAERGGEAIRLQARRGVVLACGGFERDEERRRTHFPGPVDLIASAPSNLGDGHRMAEAVGAALARMDQANIAPAIPARVRGLDLPLGTFYHREPSALLIDRGGRRFVNEYLFNLGEVLLQKDAATGAFAHLPAWLVADASLLRAAPVMNHFLRADPTFMRRAGDLDELAAQIGVPGDTLKATVQRFNGFAAKGTDSEFGRHLDPLAANGLAPERLAPLRKPPFVAMPFNLTFLSTKGGPRTDSRGQVLRPDGSAIGGLYCAGVAMANPFGTRAVGQGTTIGPNMTWGWICGRTLTGELAETVDLEGEPADA